MSRTNFDTLLEAGCHFGHLKRKWNPAMAPYIFMERNGIHIIDLHKTVAKIDDAAEALKGKRVLIVDDVISTGESLKCLEILAQKAGANIVGKMAILAEGEAADRDDIIYLEKLPLFNPDGSIKE